jgi:hypothetical protein
MGNLATCVAPFRLLKSSSENSADGVTLFVALLFSECSSYRRHGQTTFRAECIVMNVRMSKGVEEIIVLRRDEQGRLRKRTIYQRSKKQKKSTPSVGPVGRVMRKIVSGSESAAKLYLDRHDESNRKKSDGWLRDLPYNTYRAARRGMRKVRRAFGLPAIDFD